MAVETKKSLSGVGPKSREMLRAAEIASLSQR